MGANIQQSHHQFCHSCFWLMIMVFQFLLVNFSSCHVHFVIKALHLHGIVILFLVNMLIIPSVQFTHFSHSSKCLYCEDDMHADWCILSRIKKLSLDDIGVMEGYWLICKYLQDHHANLKVCDQLICFWMPLQSLEMFQFVVHLLNLNFYFQVRYILSLNNTISFYSDQYKFDIVCCWTHPLVLPLP